MASLANYISENFPSPSEGDEFLWGGVRYTYDSTPGIWAGSIPDPDAVQDVATETQPEDPINGELWYDRTNNRMNVFVDGLWKDANPQPTAEELGIMPAIAVSQDGTVVELNTTVMNFTGDIQASMSAVGEVSVGFNSPFPDLPSASSMGNMYYALEVDTSGNPEWKLVSEASNNIALDDLSDVVAPFGSTPNGNILASTGAGFAFSSPADLNLVTTSDLTPITAGVSENKTAAETNASSISTLNDTVTNDIAPRLTTAETAATALAGRVTTEEGKVTTLEGKVTPLETQVSTLMTDVDALEAATIALNDLTDVTVGASVTDGHVLTWDGSTWGPSSVPAGSGSTSVSIPDNGRSITTSDGTTTTTTQIPVIISGSVSVDDGLVLETNGDADDVAIPLTDILSTISPFNLTVEGDTAFTEVSHIAYSNEFDVSQDNDPDYPEGTVFIELSQATSEILEQVETNKTNIATAFEGINNGNSDVNALNTRLSAIEAAAPEVTSDIDTLKSDVDTLETSVETLMTDVAGLEEGEALVVQQDGTTRNNDTGVLNFTGDGVTVTNKGNGRVEVAIAGGAAPDPDDTEEGIAAGVSVAQVQTEYDKSSERADKTQFHLNGGTAGAKFRVIMKNNHASSTYNTRYNFELSTSKTPNDNISAGVMYADYHGLWDSDDEMFRIFPSNTNGQINWDVNSFTNLAPRSVMQLEIDVRPGGRVSFFTSSDNIVWHYSSIGGFAEAFEPGMDEDPGTETPVEPSEPVGPNYATGDPLEGFAGPFFVHTEPGHYEMTWRSGSAADMNKDVIMGGNFLEQVSGGNAVYGSAAQGVTSFNQGVWAVSYYSPAGTINDNFSIGCGIVFPGSTAPGSAGQGYIDELNQYIEKNQFSSASFYFSKATPGQYAGTSADILPPGSRNDDWYQAAPNFDHGPNLGAFGDAQAFASWTGSQDWHSFTNCQFYLPGAGKIVEIARGKVIAIRQSPSNSAARVAAYEMYFRTYEY